MKIKRKVLVMLGWNDPVVYATIGRYAQQAGWHLESRSYFNEMIPSHWRGEGMIVSHGDRPDIRRFIRQQAPRQPTVILGGNNPGIQAPMVTNDNHAAGRLAALHLLERGHRHFAWLSLTHGDVITDRCNGFAEALQETGYNCERLDYHPLQRHHDNWGHRRRWVAKALHALPHPLGLFAGDDQMASETIEVCLEEGLRVPEDVAVIGAGNIPIACECSHVPITSVDLRDEEVAWQAATLLDNLMNGKRPPREPVVIPPKGIVLRQSTDFLAITHPAVSKAVQFINNNLSRPITMDEVATAAGISRRMLYYIFQEELRRSPAEHLRQERMSLARRLLTETDQTIGQVATDSGLFPARNINRCFWRVEGMSPRAWRKKHRER